MPLPRISYNNFKLILPSSKKEVSYRPFLVREENELTKAFLSEDVKVITKVISEVIQNCISDKSIKINQLPTFDIEYLFLNIRAKAIGEEIEVNITAPDDRITIVPVKININDINVVETEGHSSKIKINDELMMEMKYPSLKQFVQANFDTKTENNMESSLELIASCVNKIYNEEEVWSTADVGIQEIVEFLEDMNSTNFKEIEKFFDTMPKLQYIADITNPITDVESKIKLQGLSSFFS